MKTILLTLMLFTSPAFAKTVNFTDGGGSATISIVAEVFTFQTINDQGECFINGEAIDCAEIGGFIEPANTDLTTTEKKDSPHGNFQ